MKQSARFSHGEGDAWLVRNKKKLPPNHDPVLELIEKTGLQPKKVLEVGCANGWRLKLLHNKYNCMCAGIDPSHAQLDDVDFPMIQGTAESLPYSTGVFDLVIYGFCLYLCDREDLFKIVAEGDRVLEDGGHIAIHDFIDGAYARKYEHNENILSYHLDYASLWLANPAYQAIASREEDTPFTQDPISVELIKKNMTAAYRIVP